MPPMDDQITDAGNPGKGVGEDKDRVFLVEQRVAGQQQGTRQAQPQNRCRQHDLLELLGRVPLHEEAEEKDRIAQPADDFPRTPFDAGQFSIVPNQVAQPIHNAARLESSRRNGKQELRKPPSRIDACRVNRMDNPVPGTAWPGISSGCGAFKKSPQPLAAGIREGAGWLYAPLSPMASTGQPSLASLQRASSSGDSGCLETYE